MNQSKNRFLELNKLYPYDIILTRRNRDKYKKRRFVQQTKDRIIDEGIVRITKSSYTHAAIVVSKLIKYESTQNGIKFSPFKPTHVLKKGNDSVLLLDVSDYLEFEVLRHPMIAQIYDEKNSEYISYEPYSTLQYFILQYALKWSYRPYPSWLELSQVFLDKFPKFKKFFNSRQNLREFFGKKNSELFLLHQEDRFEKPIFCSQLIVDLFRMTNAPLFPECREEWLSDQFSVDDLSKLIDPTLGNFCIDSKKIYPQDLTKSLMTPAPVWWEGDISNLRNNSSSNNNQKLKNDIKLYTNIWLQLNNEQQRYSDRVKKFSKRYQHRILKKVKEFNDNKRQPAIDDDKFTELVRKPAIFCLLFDLEKVILGEENSDDLIDDLDSMELNYQGDTFYRLPHGKGRLIYSNSNSEDPWPEGRIYEGQFLLGFPHGKGNLIFPDGRVFEGWWSRGVMFGVGLMKQGDGIEYKVLVLSSIVIDQSNSKYTEFSQMIPLDNLQGDFEYTMFNGKHPH